MIGRGRKPTPQHPMIHTRGAAGHLGPGLMLLGVVDVDQQLGGFGQVAVLQKESRGIIA